MTPDPLTGVTDSWSSAPKIHRVLALSWIVVPPLFLSALIHMADPDVDGWSGLVSSSVIWSVSLGGAFVAACVACCILVFVSFGRWVFLIIAGLLSVACGLTLAIVGSGATTTAGVLWAFVGSTTVVLLVVFVAALPALLLKWSQVRSRRAGGNPGGIV